MKNEHKFLAYISKEMFQDYTRDLFTRFPGKTDKDISLRDLIDFVDEWVDDFIPEVDNATNTLNKLESINIYPSSGAIDIVSNKEEREKLLDEYRSRQNAGK